MVRVVVSAPRKWRGRARVKLRGRTGQRRQADRRKMERWQGGAGGKCGKSENESGNTRFSRSCCSWLSFMSSARSNCTMLHVDMTLLVGFILHEFTRRLIVRTPFPKTVSQSSCKRRWRHATFGSDWIIVDLVVPPGNEGQPCSALCPML